MEGDCLAERREERSGRRLSSREERGEEWKEREIGRREERSGKRER